MLAAPFPSRTGGVRRWPQAGALKHWARTKVPEPSSPPILYASRQTQKNQLKLVNANEMHLSTPEESDSSVIGRRGERTFAELYERAGLRIGKPDPDMTGKDFLVEFPFARPEGAYTLDNRPIPLSFYVQVKTVTHRTNRVRINLKAAERLARESKPTFIAVVRLDKDGNTSNVYMIHIYDSILNSIRKRLREEHARESFNIGGKFTSISVNDIIPLEPGPQAVRNFVSLHVGSSMVDYANRKGKQLEELGYGDYRYKLKMRFSALPFEQFVDGFLGLRELSAETIDHFDRRFGVNLLNRELSTGTTSTVRIQPHSTGRCTLEVIGQNTGETAKVEGDIYFAPLSMIPPKFFKFRLKTAMFDMHVTLKRFHISMDNDIGNKSYSLNDIYSAL